MAFRILVIACFSLLLLSCDGLIDSPTEGVKTVRGNRDLYIYSKVSIDYAPLSRGKKADVFVLHAAAAYENGILIKPESILVDSTYMLSETALFNKDDYLFFHPYKYFSYSKADEQEFLSKENFEWNIDNYFSDNHSFSQGFSGIPSVRGLTGIDTISREELLSLQLMSDQRSNYANLLYYGISDENGEIVTDSLNLQFKNLPSFFESGDFILDYHIAQNMPEKSFWSLSVGYRYTNFFIFNVPFDIESIEEAERTYYFMVEG